MKSDSLKQLQEAVRILNFAAGNIVPTNTEDTKEDILNALKYINSAIFIETPSTGRKFDLYKITAQSTIRPIMGGIFHDEGYKVASDSHVLVAVKESYDEALEHHVIGKTGEDIIGKYPKWREVFPSKENKDGEFTIDTEAVYQVLREEKAGRKSTGKHGAYRRGYIKVGSAIFPVGRFAKICTFMDAYGCNKITTFGCNRSAMVEAPDGSKALIFPTMFVDYPGDNGYMQLDKPAHKVWEEKHDACIWYEVA